MRGVSAGAHGSGPAGGRRIKIRLARGEGLSEVTGGPNVAISAGNRFADRVLRPAARGGERARSRRFAAIPASVRRAAVLPSVVLPSVVLPAVVLAAAFVLASPMAAHAADPASPSLAPEAAPDVPFTWSGAYLGLQGGFLDAEVNTPDATGSADGFVGGVHVGYDWQLGGNLLLGAYADVDFTNAEIELDGARVGELDFVARGMAKLGYDGLDRMLLYAQGGVAYLSADVPGLGDPELDEAGWAAGVGIDYAVTDKLAVGADYLYHEFDDVGSGGDQFGTSDVDVDAHTVRAKFRYKF